MKGTELLRLVWLNINQNRFKSIMTSIGIVVGAATIVMVIGIGRGGQMDIADQFAELNAGAIDVSYDYAGEDETDTGGFSFGKMGNFFGTMMGGMFGGGRQSTGTETASGFSGGNAPGGQMPDSPMNNQMQPPGGDSGSSEAAGNMNSDQMPGRGNRNGEMEMPNASGETAPDDSFGNEKDKAMGNNKTENSETGNDGTRNGETENNEIDKNTVENEKTDSGETDGEEADETSMIEERLNQEQIILNDEDVDDIETYITGITGATISYHTKTSVEGGNLVNAQTYTVAGVKDNFASLSKLELSEGYFLDDTDDEARSRVCVLGATVAGELFDSTSEAVNSTIYIDDRSYTILGVLSASNTVASGISPDSSIFIPYQTGIKYIVGETIDPTITVIAEDVNTLQSVITNVKTVLTENYPNASFTFEDSGSKMKAAEASNRTLTMLLSAMAAIVFLVGGIGIMNVLFVSVKERTNEIGILKAIGTAQSDILLEFLTEAAAISLIGGMMGVALSFGITPLVTYFDVRVEVNLFACLATLGFAVLTGTIFGIYPAWKASRLEPVEALTAE